MPAVFHFSSEFARYAFSPHEWVDLKDDRELYFSLGKFYSKTSD
jgi:hypothetical protein